MTEPRTDPAVIVERCAELVREKYLFADTGARAAELLLERLADGRYPADAAALARAVTDDLQQVSADLHLRLKHHLDPVPDLGDPAAEAAAYDAMCREDMSGVRRIERLAGNVGLLEIAPMLYPAASAGAAIAAALQILSTTNALILDLRENTGGDPGCVALLCTYLLGDEPTHLTSMVPRDESLATQSWTLPWVPGPRFGTGKPVWVLTSARTFSGGEELAYDLQQLARAVVVGERTGGGAHAREGFAVHQHLELCVPIVAARNAVSGTNWEGVGVTPDVEVAAADAADVAHRAALDTLAADGTLSAALRREIAAA